MKKEFFAGIILGLICAFSVAYASENIVKIKSAEYNESAVFFNGEKIDLKGKNLISVTNEGENNITNYMPLRSVIESLGYGVVWGYEYPNGIGIFSEDYLINSEEWIDFSMVIETINETEDKERMDYLTERIKFVEENQSVHISFDVRHSWDIKTAVIGDKVYVERGDLNNVYNLFNLPFILTLDEIAAMEAKQKEYSGNPDKFVNIDMLWEINLDEESKGLSVSWYKNSDIATDIGTFRIKKITYDESRENSYEEVIADVELFPIGQEYYVRKEDVNPYLIEYGYEPIT